MSNPLSTQNSSERAIRMARFVLSLNEQQLDRLQKILCVDVNGDPCGMDFRSVDPDCYDCRGTGFTLDRKS